MKMGRPANRLEGGALPTHKSLAHAPVTGLDQGYCGVYGNHDHIAALCCGYMHSMHETRGHPSFSFSLALSLSLSLSLSLTHHGQNCCWHRNAVCQRQHSRPRRITCGEAPFRNDPPMEQDRQCDETYSVARAVQFALADVCNRANSGPPRAALTRTRAPLAPNRARRLPPCDVGTLPGKPQDGHCAMNKHQDVKRGNPVACTVAMQAYPHSVQE